MSSGYESERRVSAEVIQALSPYDAGVPALALRLRNLVLQQAPQASELLYDSYNAVAIAFTFTDRLAEAFCHVAVYSKHVNLGFNRGAELPDPDAVLEGSGKLIRHLNIQRAADLEDVHLQHFLRLAVAHARRPQSVGPEPGLRVRATSPRTRRRA